MIVDMAAEQGGNCELTRPGIDTVHRGVIISGPVNLPSMLSSQASRMYARNILSLLLYIVQDGTLRLDFEDEIIGSACVTHDGSIRNEKVRAAADRSGS